MKTFIFHYADGRIGTFETDSEPLRFQQHKENGSGILVNRTLQIREGQQLSDESIHYDEIPNAQVAMSDK